MPDKKQPTPKKHSFRPLKQLRVRVKRRLGWLGIPKIVPYTAYGDHDKIMVTGAVIEDKGISPPEPDQSVWKNILNMVKRYSGDEIEGAMVRIEYAGRQVVIRTNELGLFHTVLPNDYAEPDRETWEPVKLTLQVDYTENQGTVTAEARVHIADPESDYIVVSDVDDTVMVSHSTRTLRKLRLMLYKNALTRSPFEGVAGFYKALHTGEEGKQRSIFYVSGSEWNLIDLLEEFFEAKGIPKGTFLLSDQKLRLFSMFRSGKKYQDKILRIRELFELYYRQSFILIGDSGQKDPEIYLKIAEMYPNRVRAIYIRHIGKRLRNQRVEKLAAEAGELGVEMVLVHSTLEAARHAVDSGFIRFEQVSGIVADKRKEERLPDQPPLDKGSQKQQAAS